MALKKKKNRQLTTAKVEYPVGVLFRMFVLGSVAVIAALWAIWRHYTVPRMPMMEPAPSATEIPIEP